MGRGAHGVVFLGYANDKDEKVAVKAIPLGRISKAHLYNLKVQSLRFNGECVFVCRCAGEGNSRYVKLSGLSCIFLKMWLGPNFVPNSDFTLLSAFPFFFVFRLGINIGLN